MRSWLLHARESFWLAPVLFGIGAIVLALGLIEVDRFLITAGIDDLPLIADLSATGGRAILSAIGGTMLGVAATAFSITISVLATTSSAYGPRLVRNFMADRGNQVVLGVLTSTFLYSLIVLRSVHTEADSSFAFVPVLAVSAAVLLAVADVAVLVYFIHHIAVSVQVTTLQRRVLDELENVIDLVYPEPAAGDAATQDAPEEGTARATERAAFPAPRTGYVEQIDFERLVATARGRGVVYRMLVMPGDYVLRGDSLVAVSGQGPGDDGASRSVLGAITLADARTPHQDLRYATQQVIEIGVRGLASGSNDPYTAVSAINALTGAFVTMSGRPGPIIMRRDEDGTVRVICSWPEAQDLVADFCSAIRTYALDQPIVLQATARLLTRVEPVATGRARVSLREEVSALQHALDALGGESYDLRSIREDLALVRGRLGAPHAE